MTSLSFVNYALSHLEMHFMTKEKNHEIRKISSNNRSVYVAFISIGNPTIRARVFTETANNLDKLFNKLQKKAVNLVRKNVDPSWIKVDVVDDVEEISFFELEKLIAKTRRNYFRYGISFDSEFRLALLEQELNGNMILRSVGDGPIEIDDKNMNHYLNYRYGGRQFPFVKSLYRNSNVFLFKTTASFIDKADLQIYDLYNGELSNGIRKVNDIGKEVRSLIERSTYFLTNQVHEDGRFTYGYFSAFGRKINTYNILRHASTLYSMAEGYEIIKDENIIHAIKRGLDYLIREAVKYKNEDTAFVVDYANNNEIKLGSNATAILAITKYTEVTGDKKYIKVAQDLARGIIAMKTPSGGFIHVLTYPSYEIKELYRIIYYEGEATFSLLRLYAIDKQEMWLDEVKKSFEYFIDKNYWKHSDHWLSYAANELTKYEPEEKYFIFGLKNANKKLSFIYHRDTTFPTFLELMMATYKMVGKIKELEKDYLLEHIDDNFLIKTIDHRAEYQRVGFFYPEVAMYMKNPSLILHGFFIRHHSLRVRIDDVEHYLSGYCQYLNGRIPELPPKYYTDLTTTK